MPHKPTHTSSIDKSFAHYRNQDHKAFRKAKPKSYYPFGRKTGADNIITEEYRENFDRIFGKGGGHGQERQEENQEGLLGSNGVVEGKAPGRTVNPPSTEQLGSSPSDAKSPYVECECGGGKTGCALCFGDGFRPRNPKRKRR